MFPSFKIGHDPSPLYASKINLVLTMSTGLVCPWYHVIHDIFSVIKHIHSDNGIFAADVFQEDCDERDQSHSFLGVNNHHQYTHVVHAI